MAKYVEKPTHDTFCCWFCVLRSVVGNHLNILNRLVCVWYIGSNEIQSKWRNSIKVKFIFEMKVSPLYWKVLWLSFRSLCFLWSSSRRFVIQYSVILFVCKELAAHRWDYRQYVYILLSIQLNWIDEPQLSVNISISHVCISSIFNLFHWNSEYFFILIKSKRRNFSRNPVIQEWLTTTKT